MIDDYLRQQDADKIAPMLAAWKTALDSQTPELYGLGINSAFKRFMIRALELEAIRRENYALHLRALSDATLISKAWRLSGEYSASDDFGLRSIIRQDEKAVRAEQERRRANG